MRTPWKFVADLVSRKPKADRPETSARDPKEIEALDHRPPGDEPARAREAAPAGRAGTVETDREPERQASAPAEIVEPTKVETDGASTEIDVVSVPEEAAAAPPNFASDATAPTPLPDKAAAARARTGKTIDKPSVAVSQAVLDPPTAVETPAKPASLGTFIEDVAGLDFEVATLQREYARKLREQNAQLRKMLARFDMR